MLESLLWRRQQLVQDSTATTNDANPPLPNFPERRFWTTMRIPSELNLKMQ
jgi:hypothetical protein